MKITRFCRFYVYFTKLKYRSHNVLSSRSFSDDISDVFKESQRLQDIPIERVRNFSIIAHVDHGKSTLADRLLEFTGLLAPSASNKQVLDTLQVERERGITVKAVTASLLYKYEGQDYLLNLIDTPGHSDFSNEVSRSLAASQGVVLLVDANQGVQAQTVANYHLASSQGLVIIPVLNKIDLKNADPDAVTEQLHNVFQIPRNHVLRVSAKFGQGVDELLKTVVERVPPPHTDRAAPLHTLIIDTWYDKYKGVLCLISIKQGTARVGDTLVCQGKTYQIRTLDLLRPQPVSVPSIPGGCVGVMGCNIRDSREAKVGDILKSNSDTVNSPSSSSNIGFIQPKPVVFAGIYPLNQSDQIILRQSLEKLCLNDSAVSMTPDSSAALGQGWRLGFLGVLHMEVFNQRLEQEFKTQAIITSPSVTYKILVNGEKNIKKYGGKELLISNPSHLPSPQAIERMEEPMVLVTLITPDEFLGDVISLCMDRRGVQESAVNIDNSRVMLKFILPLSEIIVDFQSKLKSVTSGFGSFDYEHKGYVPSNLVKVEVHLNGQSVEELSFICHASKATLVSRQTCNKLLDIIPRQQFLVAIQAKVGAKILARENLKPYRKDVTQKLKSGGDVGRRQKLLRRQAEGKEKLRMVGNISLPRDTFIQLLKR